MNFITTTENTEHTEKGKKNTILLILPAKPILLILLPCSYPANPMGRDLGLGAQVMLSTYKQINKISRIGYAGRIDRIILSLCALWWSN